MTSRVLLLIVVTVYTQTTSRGESRLEYRHRRSGRAVQDQLVPPVIFNQTLGPVYIKDSKQYTRIYCEATKGASISWEYQGLNISDANVQEYIRRQEGIQFQLEHGGSTLVIYDHQHRAISGYVQCFVSNQMGATFGDKVFVSHAVLGFLEGGTRRTDIVAMEGDHVTLSCDHHIETEPAADVTWFFGSQLIHPMTKQNFFCNHGMTMCVLSGLAKSDSGVYKCYYNIPGTSKEIYKAFVLRVVESAHNPRAVHPLNLMDHVSSPSLVEAHRGADVRLQCAFRGDVGATRITWSYAEADTSVCSFLTLAVGDGSAGIAVERNGTVLHIGSLTAEHEGYYQCLADNGYDRYAHRIQLRIVAPPALVDKVHGVEAHLGETVRFNCSVSEAVPDAVTTWWVNMSPVPTGGRLGRFHTEDSGDVLVLDGATVDDTSSITCNVSNRVGSVLGHRYVSVRNISLTTEAPQELTTEWNNVKPNDTGQPVDQITQTSVYWTSAVDSTGGPTAVSTQSQLATTGEHTTAVMTNNTTATNTRQISSVFTEQPAGVSTEQLSETGTPTATRRNESEGETGKNTSVLYGLATEMKRLQGVRYDAMRNPQQTVTVSRYQSLTMVITVGLLGLIIGLVIGFLVTWVVMRRHIRKQRETAGVIQTAGKPTARRSPLHRLQVDGKTSKSETMSMMHEGSVLETIT